MTIFNMILAIIFAIAAGLISHTVTDRNFTIFETTVVMLLMAILLETQELGSKTK